MHVWIILKIIFILIALWGIWFVLFLYYVSANSPNIISEVPEKKIENEQIKILANIVIENNENIKEKMYLLKAVKNAPFTSNSLYKKLPNKDSKIIAKDLNSLAGEGFIVPIVGKSLSKEVQLELSPKGRELLQELENI